MPFDHLPDCAAQMGLVRILDATAGTCSASPWPAPPSPWARAATDLVGLPTRQPVRDCRPTDTGAPARSWLTDARGRCVRSHRSGALRVPCFRASRATWSPPVCLANEITPTYVVGRAPGIQLLPVHLGSRARAACFVPIAIVVAEPRHPGRSSGMRTRGRCPGGTVGHPCPAGVRSGKMREGPVAGTVGEGREPVFVRPRRSGCLVRVGPAGGGVMTATADRVSPGPALGLPSTLSRGAGHAARRWDYTTPRSSMVSATLRKPAMFAPST